MQSLSNRQPNTAITDAFSSKISLCNLGSSQLNWVFTMDRRKFLITSAILANAPYKTLALEKQEHCYKTKIAMKALKNPNFQQRSLPRSFNLSEEIKNDFAADRIMEIDGWLLSETEVQYCVDYYQKTRS